MKTFLVVSGGVVIVGAVGIAGYFWWQRVKDRMQSMRFPGV